MSKMFEKYTALNLEAPSEEEILPKGVKRLYNKNDLFYGVEAQHQMPFSLYFHLTEASDKPLTTFVSDCEVEFEIRSIVTHKPVVFKKFLGNAIFNSTTNDLKIEINQEDAQQLKQETYTMTLKLVYATGFYILHNEQNGVLVIR